jgi:hypothetical protein
MQRLTESADVPVPVVQSGRVVGLLHQGDILKWLSLHNLYPGWVPSAVGGQIVSAWVIGNCSR